MVKESSFYVRSSPYKGIYRDPSPKPKTNKSTLSGKVVIVAEKSLAVITLIVKGTPKKQPRIEEELSHEEEPYMVRIFNPLLKTRWIKKGRN